MIKRIIHEIFDDIMENVFHNDPRVRIVSDAICGSNEIFIFITRDINFYLILQYGDLINENLE